jgi:hypothetical protein
MKDDILEQISKYKAPSRLPPIANKAYDLWASGGNKLSDESVAILRKDLEKFYDDLKALTDAICGLGAFAIYARDYLKDTDASDKVVKLIQETAPKYTSIGERIAAALQDLANKATGLLDKFTDRESVPKNVAPKFDGDEAPPVGTVPLKQLKPLGGPPPLRDRNKKPTE